MVVSLLDRVTDALHRSARDARDTLWKVRMHKDRQGRGMWTSLYVEAPSAEEARNKAGEQAKGSDYPYSSSAKRATEERGEGWYGRDARLRSGDPLTPKGEEVLAAMKKQYGDKKGESVFYASANKGTISGVHDASEEEGAEDLDPDDPEEAAQNRMRLQSSSEGKGSKITLPRGGEELRRGNVLRRLEQRGASKDCPLLDRATDALRRSI